MFGVVAAFGLAPDTVTEDIAQETWSQALTLPAPALTDSGSFDFWREERIGSGETLSHLLQRLGVAQEEISAVLTASRETKALGHLTVGRTVLARVTSTGRLISLQYLPTEDRLITLQRVNNSFRMQESAIKPTIQQVTRGGAIDGSLFGATDAANVPDSVASQLAEIFSSDIDFHRDLRKGDRFSVIYESYTYQGSTIKTGRLLAAEFINGGQSYRAFYFRDPKGRDGYYTTSGQNMRRAFLKSPMPFTRISSGFSNARYHPVLNEWRAHRGIDYAAPTGTPIRAVADAVVSFSGRQGGYGNLVVLNHQGPYSTAYGHLSRFAKGVKRGSRVSQGQVIGYVGSTGLATGPHLHYEFRVNGEQKNPLALKLPNAYPLAAQYRNLFVNTIQPLAARLDMSRNSRTAFLD
ncbi:murein DD-endopeptidase MepM/ murein hydrolase activator NlpD [Sulfuritortus calidifontis]|uniref:DD-carboxypeptidase/endopeptidase Mpg n=2 Tax=Sulfuritortus calidifontis TaxID=1914471 RepID=A0A4R3JWB7_9PROT|nr:murein DD-endopeptidase MepM/ murein hydrolase activator NlpD [Sulfuritortus calidifontis]